MKKISLFFIIIALALTFCACKNQNANAVDNLILEIGEITNEHFNAEALSTAFAAYNALSDADKAAVEHYNALTQQRDNAFGVIETAIEDAISNSDLETAYWSADAGLNYDFYFTDEQKEALSSTIRFVEEICYAGTFIAMPEKLIEEVTPKVTDRSIGSDYPTYFEYKYSGGKGEVAFKRYTDYLSAAFEYLESETWNDGTIYVKYIDKNNNIYYLTYKEDAINGSNFLYGPSSTMCFEFSSQVVDWSRVDTTKEGLSLRDIDEVLIRS